jgi:hypothetical protein
LPNHFPVSVSQKEFFLLEHFALSQRDYGKYVPALAPGGAARSTKVLSKRAIEGPSI